MSDSTTDDELTVEVSTRTASAVLHILGLQQWLCPNHPPEYAKEGLARADGAIRLHEAYLEAIDASLGTVPLETAANAVVERYLDNVAPAVVADVVAESEREYHERLYAVVQTWADEASIEE